MTTAQLMHFVVKTYYYTLTVTGYKIVCYTNNPCHLWLRWTNVEPQRHVNPKIVRGAVAGTWIDQCFVVYHDVEQNEAGDTTTHTFILEPWPVCEKRWFYFYGTVGGVLSPSASAIFAHHRTAPTIITPCHNTPANATLQINPGYCTRYAYAIRPCVTFKPNQLSFWLKGTAGRPFLAHAKAEIWTANASAGPQTLIADSPWTGLAGAPPTPTKYTFTLTIPPTLTLGNYYSVCLWTGTRIDEITAYVWICLTNVIDTCPHPQIPMQRVYYMDCGYVKDVPCTWAGQPWGFFVSYPITYELTGTPL